MSSASSDAALTALQKEIKALQGQQEASTRHLADLQRDLAALHHQAEIDLTHRHEKEVLLEMNLDNEKEALVDFSSSIRHFDDIHLHSVLLQDVFEEDGEDSDDVTAATSLSAESQKLVAEATNVIRANALRLQQIIDDDTEAEFNHRIALERTQDKIRCVQVVIDRRQDKIVTLCRDLHKLQRLREEQLEKARRKERQARIDNLIQQHRSADNTLPIFDTKQKMSPSLPPSYLSQPPSSSKAMSKKTSRLKVTDEALAVVGFRKKSQSKDGDGAARTSSKRRSFVGRTA